MANTWGMKAKFMSVLNFAYAAKDLVWFFFQLCTAWSWALEAQHLQWPVDAALHAAVWANRRHEPALREAISTDLVAR
eukprot:6200624-Lingulodinium_polyedra.AAC.1